MTYGIIHYDVEVDFFIHNPDENEEEPNTSDKEKPTHTETLSKMFLGRFPIMLMSDLCILSGMSPSVRFELGECRNDRGGYFIIDGKEKCIVPRKNLRIICFM